MENITNRNNDVNGAGSISAESATSGRCPMGEQRGPGRHPATARTGWSKEMNIAVMECYYLSNPVDDNGKPVRGYRRRMHSFWKERQSFNITEQRLCDQARLIRKNNWLTALQLAEIKDRVWNVSVVEGTDNYAGDVGEEVVEVNNTVKDDSCLISANIEELSNEEREIIEELNSIIKNDLHIELQGFKKVDRTLLRKHVKSINGILKNVATESVTGTNDLLKACAILIGRKVGLKPVRRRANGRKEPWWKRRINQSIKELRKHVNILERKRKGALKRTEKYKLLEDKYKVKKKGLGVVLEELKQRLQAKSMKIKRYDQRIEQYRINRLFQQDQKQVYQQLNGKVNSGEKPDADESRRFWSSIWGRKVHHKREAAWLRDLRANKNDEKQNDIKITIDMVTKQLKKIPNWKYPGPDGVQGYWLKNFTELHKRMADQFNGLLNNGVEIPKWMTTGKTVLCLKDPSKGSAVDNYRPITCLPLMWKLMTGILSNVLYDFLEGTGKLPNEQKGCRRKSRGTKDQLLIDRTVLNDCRKRHTNLGMAWIDYKKAYDMVPHSWIQESLELSGVANNVVEFIARSMKTWNVELMSCGEFLAKVNIRRGIFQGDSLSPLLFVICMFPLTEILRQVQSGYTLKCGERLNHLLFMDDLKIYGKNEREINALTSTVEIFSTDIGMEFGIKKCGTLILKRGKVVRSDGIELPSGEKIKEIEETGYKYLGITEYDKIEESTMKENFRTEYIRRTKVIMKSRLHGRNKIKALNTWAVSLLRYGAGIIKWTVGELDAMDRKTRKIMTINKELHPKSDVDRLYISRSKGGRGLIGCKNCVITEENSLGWYVVNHIEPLIVAVKESNTLPGCRNAIKPTEFKKLKQQERINNWKDKTMHGQYLREMNDKDKNNTWRWLQKSDLKGCTEALICSAQEQALRTNYTKCRIDKTIDSPLCRMCGIKHETVYHIVSECSKLAQREYKRRHDNVARYIHWRLCGKFDHDRAKNWYEHNPEGVSESANCKILWDVVIQCDKEIEARRPDIVVLDKTSKEVKVIDIAIPGDVRVCEKELEKINKYKLLKDEIARLWNVRKVTVIPIVVGALGAITTRFEKFVMEAGIELRVEHVQKTALLGTARILRLVLGS